MQQQAVQPTTSPLRSCTSPILSRWQFLRTHCKWHITSTRTRRTIDFVQWAVNTEPVRKCEHCTFKSVNCICMLMVLQYYYYSNYYTMTTILLRSVCLSVCPSDNWKNCEGIVTKFLGGVGHGPRTKWLNFGHESRSESPSGSRSPKSGFTGLSKKYLVDSDQNCVAESCKNHSAILLCWRSAEVCALWVLLILNCMQLSVVFCWIVFSRTSVSNCNKTENGQEVSYAALIWVH